MPPLPRGVCPVCLSDVALRKRGRVREHRRRPVMDTTCAGSGMATLRVTFPAALDEARRAQWRV